MVIKNVLAYNMRAGNSYDDKRACNKRTGPGGGTRRLHHKRSVLNSDRFYWGRNRIDRRVKMLAFVRMGIVKCPIIVDANDNSAEELALAA